MTKPLAVYTDTDDLSPAPGIELLEAAGFEVRHLETTDKRKIIAGAQGASALLVGYAEIDAEIIEALPSVEIYSLLSMGFNNIDVDAATRHGKWVSNVRGAATDEVAEHTIALALAVARGLRPFNALVEGGEWNITGAPAPKQLGALRFSVLGFGRIGRKVAELAQPIFGKVLVHDPFVPAEVVAENAHRFEFVSLDEAIAAADVLSLHMPLTPENHGLLNAERLASMPAGSIVVNASRGELVDEAALLASLNSGHTYGAGLDVLVNEPPTADDPLLGRPDVIVTPHTGFLSERTYVEYPVTQAKNVIAHAETGRPLTPVNELS